ncbi:beta-methylgalactoside transporter permease, partial [Klebsiella pneumoniae]
SFSGGGGTGVGVVTGVVFFTVVHYGRAYIGGNPFWEDIIKGAHIIFALALGFLKYPPKK